MRKIIFVIQSMGFGGAERSLINLLHELPADRYQIDLLLFRREGAFLEQLPSNVRVLEQPKGLCKLYAPVSRSGLLLPVKVLGTWCSWFFGKTRKQRAAFRWKHFYRKAIGLVPGTYDVAVAYSGAEVMYLVTDCIQAKKKYVWIHNDYHTAGYSQKDDQFYFPRMDGIVSVSDECVSILKNTFPEYAQRIYKIENITSSVLVRAAAGKLQPREYEGHKCILVSIGRLEMQKGFDIAISAAALLKKRQDFVWFIIGEGNLRDSLEKQIRQAGVVDQVILLGSRTNPYPYIKNADLLVQPSRYEGKSVVLDEAKILCTPIVATDYPTVRDQICQYREGVVAPMDPVGLAATLYDVLSDQDLTAQMRNAMAETNYGNQAEIAKYMELFSMEDSITILKREFGRNICQNLQAWWFDQIIGGKRYKHEDIYALFEKQQKIAHEAYNKDRIKNSEIAFIYDEESYHVVAEETTHQMVELFRNYEIDIIGAPCDRYYHNDMADPNMPDY
jgi:glycosyltransferase involved in cell wall biosynthesis